MVFKGICFVLLTLTTLPINAQPVRYAHIPQEEREKASLELINEAEYVVEGKSKGFRYFYGDDGETIYTEFTFEVSHWYKGNGRNTISIVKKGGRIGNDNQFNHNDYLYPDRVMAHIILLKEGSAKDTYEFLKEISPVIARSNDGSVWGGFYNLGFDSFDELTTFLSKAEGMKMPVKKKDVGSVKSSIIPAIDFIHALPINPDNPNPPIPITRAGVGDVIVISGSGFGTKKGKVFFRNADEPEIIMNGTPTGIPIYLDDLDDFYYDTSNPNGDNPTGWKNDEIRVIVPSWIPSATGREPGAGSGRIKVKLPDNENNGTVTPGAISAPSDQILIVEYSIVNHSQNIGNLSKNPVRYGYVGMEHCLSGYVFTLHNSFAGNAQSKIDARASIEAALTAWKDKLDITLQLEKDASENYVYTDFTQANNRAVISFGNDVLMTQGTNMQADLWGLTTNYRRQPVYLKIEQQVPNPNPLFNVDWEFRHTGSLASGKSDFYAALLHEIGHFIGADHSVVLIKDDDENPTDMIDYNNVMSYAHRIPNATVVQMDRMNLNNYDNDKTTVDPCELIVAESRNHMWSSNFTSFYGVKTLAAAGDQSMVKPTPGIIDNVLYSNINGYTLVEFEPVPDNPLYDYYFYPKGARFKWTCGGIKPSTHAVRIVDENCTVSSLYSAPITIGTKPFCLANREDAPEPSIYPLMTIYPNPTRGHLDIQFKSTEEEKVLDITESYMGIYDNLGRLQTEHRVNDTTLRQATIDISTLPAGMYWVVWFADGEVIDTQQVQKTD